MLQLANGFRLTQFVRQTVQALVLAETNFTMSRFGNLELAGESEDQWQPQQKALVKDEAYYFGEARPAFETGNFELALRFYSKVLEYNPKNAAAWTAQVRMLIELGEFREAKFWADKALERFPNGRNCSPPRLSRSDAPAICKARWPFRTRPSRNAVTRLTSGLRAAT